MSIVPELLDLVAGLEDGPQMSLSLHFDRGHTGLDVRSFAIDESLSTPFAIEIEAVSRDHHLDLSAIVGLGAGFAIASTLTGALQKRLWEGICTEAELVKTLPDSIGSLSTYRLRIEHGLAQLRYRTDSRIFQGLTIPQIVEKVLDRWQVPTQSRLTVEYPALEYCVQYGETDLAFISRLLEEAGISYFYEHGERSELVLSDAPEAREPRSPITFNDETSERGATNQEFVTEVRLSEQMRPTRYTLRGNDFLVKADDRLDGKAVNEAAEARGTYETYRYDPHAFRSQEASRATGEYGDRSAALRLDAERRGVRSLFAKSNSVSLPPGTTVAIERHPRSDVAEQTLVITRARLSGDGHHFAMTLEAVFADMRLVPERNTPRPKISVQSAIVVGPAHEEIHVDAHGRVKVQFHWDRDGMFDDGSSCWVRVSQGVAGSAQGMVAHCRVGQEVLVDFFDGDPDQPVVVGRVFNAVNPAPYSLPKHKAWTGIKTDTYPRSGGFNQLMFQDDRGDECIHLQAQRNYAEVVKLNQSSQVGAARTAQVGNTDLLVVGNAQLTDVGNRSVERVGVEKQTHVGKTRISTIGEHDYIEAGESFTVTTGNGTGVQISGSSQRIALTNGLASIVIDGPNVFIDAQNGIQLTGQNVVRADAVAGKVEINCGASEAFGKPAGAATAVCTIPEAELPQEPGAPGLKGGTSVAPYKHKPAEQPIVAPVPYRPIQMTPWTARAEE